MPRAAKLSVEVIFDSIKDLMFFDNSGKLKPLSQSIWNDAIIKLQNKMSIKHLYLHISRNGHKIQDMLRKWHGIEQNPEISILDKNCSDSNWSMNVSTEESLPSLRVTIYFRQ